MSTVTPLIHPSNSVAWKRTYSSEILSKSPSAMVRGDDQIAPSAEEETSQLVFPSTFGWKRPHDWPLGSWSDSVTQSPAAEPLFCKPQGAMVNSDFEPDCISAERMGNSSKATEWDALASSNVPQGCRCLTINPAASICNSLSSNSPTET